MDTLGQTQVVDNRVSLALLAVVVLVVTTTPHLFSRIPAFTNPDHPTAVMAVVAGMIVSLVAYLPIKHLYASATAASPDQIISLSVLVSLLVTYFMLFEIKSGVPSISAIALLVFMFYYHIDSGSLKTH